MGAIFGDVRFLSNDAKHELKTRAHLLCIFGRGQNIQNARLSKSAELLQIYVRIRPYKALIRLSNAL